MERNVIIIMIVCATLIAIIAIICDFLSNKKIQTSTENLLTQKIIKLHRNYIVGFLSFAVITIISAKYGGPNNNIFDYLSFGSTITSLVLSVLAIFVTVQSSSDLYKQFTRIDNATETITTISKQLDGTLDKITDVEKKLTLTSNTITNQIDSIISRVDEKLKERMQETEHKLSEQINSLNISTVSGKEQNSEEALDFVSKLKTYYLNSISATGALAIYACILSKDYNKEFILPDLLKGNELYAYGFLVSTISSGLLNAKIEENYKISCSGSEYTQEEIINILKNQVVKFGQDFLNQINTINRYFGINELIVDLKSQE
ncbi:MULTISPECIES: hypothetical protein [Phocaeicola]|uniref:Uncharacterized protein n=1 Tax=Phocaeicola plebeius TaxID=310297 RepID=A0A414FUD2_9BACT|nr:hypothetical protein [Phocaeicola plebeius]RHD54493.1 hypothetical protein DW789_08000 [Phocaeicola plebeius]